MKRIKKIAVSLGIHKLFALRNLGGFISDYVEIKRQVKNNGLDRTFSVNFKEMYPILSDKTASHGFDRHYVFHTSWAARKVKEIGPAIHVDISSSLYFCGILSSFIPVSFFDYRPADMELSGLTCNRGDLLSLPFETDTVESISCMHVIEHIGLGRYGDPIDVNGDIKAIKELVRVTKSGGHIIFVTPVGTSAIKFNAHRIYSYNQIVERFNGCSLKEFSLIQDDKFGGSIVNNAEPDLVKKQAYGCGLFVFVKD